MDSKDLARYIEQTDSISKPWMLIQLQLHKLKERQAEMAPEAYLKELEELRQALMNLGEWWVGREDELF